MRKSWGAALLCVAMGAALMTACSRRADSEDSPPGAQARYGCMDFVKRLAHDPESIDFGNSWDWPTTGGPNGQWEVRMSFRAKNSFGATVLTNKTCSVQVSGSNVSLLKMD